MAMRITTVSITPASNTVSGTFTVANTTNENGKWLETDASVHPVTNQPEGFYFVFDGQTFEFVVNQQLRDQVQSVLDKFFSEPQSAKKILPKPSKANPSPKPFWLAYTDSTISIECSIGSWQLRPGLRWSDPTATPVQVWLINRKTATLAYKPVAKITFA